MYQVSAIQKVNNRMKLINHPTVANTRAEAIKIIDSTRDFSTIAAWYTDNDNVVQEFFNFTSETNVFMYPFPVANVMPAYPEEMCVESFESGDLKYSDLERKDFKYLISGLNKCFEDTEVYTGVSLKVLPKLKFERNTDGSMKSCKVFAAEPDGTTYTCVDMREDGTIHFDGINELYISRTRSAFLDWSLIVVSYKEL